MNSRALAEGIVRALVRGRMWVVLGLVVATLSAWAVCLRAAGDRPQDLFDNRVEVWFLDTDPAVTAYHEFQRTFGNDEAVVIAFGAPEGQTVFGPETLTLVARLSTALSHLHTVQGVTSLATVLDVSYTPGEPDMDVGPFFRLPLQPGDAERARARVLDSPLYRDALVSADERRTLLTVQLVPALRGDGSEDVDIERHRGQILEEIRAVVDEHLVAAGHPPGDWNWGGVGVINQALNDLSLRDTTVFSSLSLLVLVAALALALRRLGPVLLCVVIVHLSSLFLTALYLGMGNTFNLVTMILPTLVIVIGVTDSVYFVSTYYQEREGHEARGLSKREAIARTVGYCFMPGFINSATTSIGFLAFSGSRMEVLRDLGVYAGVGIMVAFLVSVLVCAAGFELLDIRPPRTAEGQLGRFLPAWIEACADFVLRHRVQVLCASALLGLASLIGIVRVRVDTYTLGYLNEGHPVRQDNEAIQAAFGPYLPLEVVIDSGRDGGALEPALLEGLDQLEHTIVSRHAPRVGNAVSLASVVKRMHEACVGDRSARAIPLRREVIEQELLFYDPARGDDPVRLLDFPRNRLARLQLRTRNDSAAAARQLLDEIVAEGERVLPPGARVVPSGYVPLYVRLIDYLVEGQLKAITITFLGVFLLIGVLFRSPLYMLVSIPSNLLPVAVTLGVMGLLDIPLDVATVLVAPVGLGIAVDDTVHYLFKFRTLLQAGLDPEQAVRKTSVSTGLPIVSTSLILTAGFLVLCLASVKSMALFGLLTAVTMLSALVGELFVTPAVILFAFRRRQTRPVGAGL